MTKCTRINDNARSDDKGTGADDEKTGDAAAPPRSTTRRSLLQMGAGLAAMSGVRRSLAAPAVAGALINLPKAPNIIVLMTDQERHHVHWPQGWAEKNLPSLQRLKRHGLYFLHAYTAACQCSPSRGLMVTGRFAPVNRVTQTFLWPGLPYQDRQPNIASLLREKAGYEVVWKGKWHLSYASNAAMGNGGEDWGPTDIEVMEKNWGWSGWNPPDAGNAIRNGRPPRSANLTGFARSAAPDRIMTDATSAGTTRPTAGKPPGSAARASSNFSRTARARSANRSACSYRSSTRTTSGSIQGPG